MTDQSGTTYRRIAQRQSASTHTEEAAAFDSCSAYQNSPRILFLSHCVPYPPDKGERIRAYEDLRRLSEIGAVHLACFARSPQEEEAAGSLRNLCASVHVARLNPRRSLLTAGARFLSGACLTTSYYDDKSLRRHLAALGSVDVTVAYSSAMAQYAPRRGPVVLDMVDVDSEKWLQYSALRRPRFAFAAEGRRLRNLETEFASRAHSLLFATRHEADVFARFAAHPRALAMENGVNFDFFNPDSVPRTTELIFPRLVFVGEMNYFPNVDAVCGFARDVFPALRKQCEGLELVIVGRHPSRAVRDLASLPAVVVTGGVADVRPYLFEALAVVAPLRIARGIQNKVLEALAMGKPVLASSQVAATFGTVPYGVVACETAAEYTDALRSAAENWPFDAAIRDAARKRFTWSSNLNTLTEAVDDALVSARL